MKVKSGWSIHCHHGILVEWCHNYQERVDYINTYKPENEQETRLRLFRLLPKKAVEELPTRLVKAKAEYDKAGAELGKASAEYDKAWAEYDKAGAEYDKAGDEWPKKKQKAFHKKWCGCSEWDGNEIKF